MNRTIAPGQPVRRAATVMKDGSAPPGLYRYCMSDNSVDRMGDTIAADGWVFDAFDRNPVVQFAHNTAEPPVGRVVNRWVTSTALFGDIEFAPADISLFGHEVEQLVANGFMNAGSVGFIPLEYNYSTDKSRPFGVDFTKQALIEFSIVPVPANANALLQAQAKGMNVRSLRGGLGDVSPANAKRLREWARDASVPDAAAAVRMERAKDLQRSLFHPTRLVESSEAEMAAGAKRHALRHLESLADTDTEHGRAAHARALRAFHAGDRGSVPVDQRAVAAEARWRTTRW